MRAEGAQMHWYMAAVMIQAVNRMGPNENEIPEDTVVGTRQIMTNVLVTPNRKKITSKTIDDIRNTALVKARDKYKVNIETDLAELAIMSVTYLGLMTEKEYNEGSTPAKT